MKDNGVKPAGTGVTAAGWTGGDQPGRERASRDRSARLRRAVPLASLVAAAALGLAACGGGGAPGTGPGSTGPGSTGPGSTSVTSRGSATDALKFAKCMRAHGLSGFPDPVPGPGGYQFRIRISPGSDLNPHSPRYQAADTACKAYSPQGNLTPAQKAAANAKALKYVQCMRSHGISSYPDPNGQGTLIVSAGPGINPYSPQFRRAEHACQSLETGFNMQTSNLPG
jgi:hypothetical protein